MHFFSWATSASAYGPCPGKIDGGGLTETFQHCPKQAGLWASFLPATPLRTEVQGPVESVCQPSDPYVSMGRGILRVRLCSFHYECHCFVECPVPCVGLHVLSGDPCTPPRRCCAPLSCSLFSSRRFSPLCKVPCFLGRRVSLVGAPCPPRVSTF